MASFADQSATSRKFELLDVCIESDDTDRGTEYVIVDMKVLQELFASTACGKCGMATVGLSKCEERQYGLAVKLVLTCSSCDFAESRFCSPRVAGEAKIPPFEINLRAMKGIQNTGKGATALADFCATLNLSHRGLHHKTFRGHMGTMVQA
ncbi:hypothetical protein ISCGN_019559 [Ixodes scapularis]